MKFLVVDDSYGWVKAHCKNILETMPEAQIDVAYSAYEGLQKAMEHGTDYYDVIISDMQMEDVDTEMYAGIWLIKQLQDLGKCKKSKIIVISATYNIKDVANNLNVDYLPKSSIVQSPSAFEYKLKELLNL